VLDLITHPPIAVTLSQGATSSAKSITKITIGADGQIHVIESDGREYVAPKEKDQVSVAAPLLAENKLAAGWLVEYENCCTSYPIPLMLVIYRPGKPLERLGNGSSFLIGISRLAGIRPVDCKMGWAPE
jgi:hypothetical protein